MPPAASVVERVAQRLFVGGGDRRDLSAMVGAVTETLPAYIDDLTREIGPGVYRQMMTDTDVSSAVETRRLQALSAPWQVVPAWGSAPGDESDVKNALARKAVVDLAAGTLDVRAAADEIYDGFLYGVKMSEAVLIPRGGRLVPGSAVGIDSRTCAMVTGAGGEFLGVAPSGILGPELDALLREGAVGDRLASYLRRIVPAWKILRLANRPRDGSLIGRSILRPAYRPWFSKTTLIPEYLKFLARFGSPSVVGKLPVSAQELSVRKDDDGLPVIDPATGQPFLENAVFQLFSQLLAWRNGSALAVPAGTEIDVVWPQGTGATFTEANGLFAREIREVILGTAQTTSEAKAESRASKDVAQNVAGLRAAEDRHILGAAMSPLLTLTTVVNEGPRYAADAPGIAFASVEQHDFLATAQGFETLARSDAILPGMYPQFWAMLGLKYDDAEFAIWLDARRAMAQGAANLVDPNALPPL